MSRREVKVFIALLVAFTFVAAALMIGLQKLGSPDELIALSVVAAFAVTAFAGGSLFDASPPDRR